MPCAGRAGRYDTAQHSLFGGREGCFLDDWYNPSLPSDVPDKPREPWHDVHCKLEGPACRDVMRNFEERWLQQVRSHTCMLCMHVYQMPWIICIHALHALSDRACRQPALAQMQPGLRRLTRRVVL